MLVNITVAVPKTKEVEDALSNRWGVCLAGICNAFSVGHGEAYMIVWSVVPVGSSAVGPAVVAMVMLRMRTTVGVTMAVPMPMPMTRTTVAATSPGY